MILRRRWCRLGLGRCRSMNYEEEVYRRAFVVGYRRCRAEYLALCSATMLKKAHRQPWKSGGVAASTAAFVE